MTSVNNALPMNIDSDAQRLSTGASRFETSVTTAAETTFKNAQRLTTGDNPSVTSVSPRVETNNNDDVQCLTTEEYRSVTSVTNSFSISNAEPMDIDTDAQRLTTDENQSVTSVNAAAQRTENINAQRLTTDENQSVTSVTRGTSTNNNNNVLRLTTDVNQSVTSVNNPFHSSNYNDAQRLTTGDNPSVTSVIGGMSANNNNDVQRLTTGENPSVTSVNAGLTNNNITADVQRLATGENQSETSVSHVKQKESNVVLSLSEVGKEDVSKRSETPAVSVLTNIPFSWTANHVSLTPFSKISNMGNSKGTDGSLSQNKGDSTNVDSSLPITSFNEDGAPGVSSDIKNVYNDFATEDLELMDIDIDPEELIVDKTSKARKQSEKIDKQKDEISHELNSSGSMGVARARSGDVDEFSDMDFEEEQEEEIDLNEDPRKPAAKKMNKKITQKKKKNSSNKKKTKGTKGKSNSGSSSQVSEGKESRGKKTRRSSTLRSNTRNNTAGSNVKNKKSKHVKERRKTPEKKQSDNSDSTPENELIFEENRFNVPVKASRPRAAKNKVTGAKSVYCELEEPEELEEPLDDPFADISPAERRKREMAAKQRQLVRDYLKRKEDKKPDKDSDLYEHKIIPMTDKYPAVQKGKFTCPYDIEKFTTSTLEFALMQVYGREYTKHYLENTNKDGMSEVEYSINTHIENRRRHLMKKPYLDINDENDKEKLFLSGLVYLHTLNETFAPEEEYHCPLAPFNRGWLNIFCDFQDDIPLCDDGPQSHTFFQAHLAGRAKKCRWHKLVLDFKRKVFVKTVGTQEQKKEDAAFRHKLLMERYEGEYSSDDEDGVRKYSKTFYEIEKYLNKEKFKQNKLDAMSDKVPIVGFLSCPYRMSIFEGVGLKESMKMTCPYMAYETYFDHIAYDEIRYYEEHYDYYLERRFQYLCDHEPDYIKIKDEKDRIFLSGLVYLTTFSDKFSEEVWCPLCPWNRNWLYHFCPFHEEIPLCKKIEDRAPMDGNAMGEHCLKNSDVCHWHHLVFQFMDKVFFKEEDHFLPKDVTMVVNKG